MLVRARRLGWSKYGSGLVSSWNSHDFYVSDTGEWKHSLDDGAVCDSGKCETSDLAKIHCQNVCNEMWLAETEVMPLEFVAWDDEKSFRIEDGYTALGATGEYELWLDDRNEVAGTFRPYGSSESNQPKTIFGMLRFTIGIYLHYASLLIGGPEFRMFAFEMVIAALEEKETESRQ